MLDDTRIFPELPLTAMPAGLVVLVVDDIARGMDVYGRPPSGRWRGCGIRTWCELIGCAEVGTGW